MRPLLVPRNTSIRLTCLLKYEDRPAVPSDVTKIEVIGYATDDPTTLTFTRTSEAGPNQLIISDIISATVQTHDDGTTYNFDLTTNASALPDANATYTFVARVYYAADIIASQEWEIRTSAAQ
jgi:hypothetical protein